MKSQAPALAIDAAEWFVDPAWRAHVAARHWRRLPLRSGIAVRAALDALRASGAQATFFVPASLADSDPDCVRELVLAGHEVALSIAAPWPLDEVPVAMRPELVGEWQRGCAALEALTGCRVRGVAAAWPTGTGDAWWRPLLDELGLAYDASGSGAALAFDGREQPIVRFAAWRLDAGQPRLMGLPKDIRLAHEQAVATGAGAFAAVLRSASGSIAARLELAAAAPAVWSFGSRAPAPAPALAPEPAAGAAQGTPLTVVVPLKDEADGIAALFRELDAVVAALAPVAAMRFVVVDDGSVDRTWELLERHAAARPNVRLVRHEQNRGVAAAIATGIAASETELVASIDGDLSYDPMELRAMLPLAASADVVTASPYHPRGGVRNVPPWRLTLSRTLSLAYRLLLRRDVRTWTSCFRVYRRSAVVDLPLANEGFLGTAELLVRVLRRGGKVVEHPCVLEARLLGFSKMRVLRTVRGHLRLLVQVALGRVR